MAELALTVFAVTAGKAHPAITMVASKDLQTMTAILTGVGEAGGGVPCDITSTSLESVSARTVHTIQS